MDDSSLIQALRATLASGRKDDYTELLMQLAEDALYKESPPPEQQAELAEILTLFEARSNRPIMSFLGSSAKSMERGPVAIDGHVHTLYRRAEVTASALHYRHGKGNEHDSNWELDA